MSSRIERKRYPLVGIGILALLLFLYSVLIARNLLAWVGLVYPLVLLYLAWRFVRAHERVADALESGEE